LRCLKRIRRWRVPPLWSRREWLEEVEAEATVATLQALSDFDPARGVPRSAFLHQRIIRAVLARYRREWAYAIHRVSAGALDEYETRGSRDSPLQEIIAGLLEEALGQLPHSDISLIEGLFWEGKSEASLAEFLGISQQAVNKRKRTIFRDLRRRIENLGIGADSGL
jgi:DNA-directed RNA polymerase specialized sigma subunit